jgi:hypothetical protein
MVGSQTENSVVSEGRSTADGGGSLTYSIHRRGGRLRVNAVYECDL